MTINNYYRVTELRKKVGIFIPRFHAKFVYSSEIPEKVWESFEEIIEEEKDKELGIFTPLNFDAETRESLLRDTQIPVLKKEEVLEKRPLEERGSKRKDRAQRVYRKNVRELTELQSLDIDPYLNTMLCNRKTRRSGKVARV